MLEALSYKCQTVASIRQTQHQGRPQLPQTKTCAWRWDDQDSKNLKDSSQCWVQEDLTRSRDLLPVEKEDGDITRAKPEKNTFCNAEKETKKPQETLSVNSTGKLGKSYDILLVASLKVCAKQKDLSRGNKLHADIVRRGLLETNVFIGSSLVNFYVKCGILVKAQHVFHELSVRDAVSWNAILAGYAQHELSEEALGVFEQMQLEGFSPTAVSFACALKACSSLQSLDKGQEIHAQIVTEGLSEEHVVVPNALVDMYAKCAALLEAQEVFDELQNRDIVSWNALISGYAQHDHSEEALACFEQMQIAGIPPDAVTFPSILKACGSLGALDKGEEVHAQIIDECLFVEKDTHMGTALVDMYSKCGALHKAQEVFDKLSVGDAVLWNALITGYAQHGQGEKAMDCFNQMQLKGFMPSAVTFACILKACGSLKSLEKGQEVHAQIVSETSLESDIHVSTALVDLYAKCGALEEAHEVFDELQFRTVASWNALLGGYTQFGLGEKALCYFQRMHEEGISPDTITFVCVLKACGSLGDYRQGQALHNQSAQFGLLGSVIIGNSLVDMYANCGMLEEAQQMFDNLPVQDVVAWSALMVGFSQVGKDELVFSSFDRMKKEGIKPDLVTFTVVLNTCSHKGLADKAEMYFEMINKDYGIIPSLPHHVCMIDLFGRIGSLDTAVSVIKEMPFLANVTVWHTLLGGCRISRNTKLGMWAFEYAVQLKEEADAAYVCLSDIYAGFGED